MARNESQLSTIYHLETHSSELITEMITVGRDFKKNDFMELSLKDLGAEYEITLKTTIEHKSTRKMKIAKFVNEKVKTSCFLLDKQMLGKDKWKLSAEIRRGARHQLRIQSAFLDMPIIGDDLYGWAEEEALKLFCFAAKTDTQTYFAANDTEGSST